jgi:membrane associated rhomboid family serine protease
LNLEEDYGLDKPRAVNQLTKLSDTVDFAESVAARAIQSRGRLRQRSISTQPVAIVRERGHKRASRSDGIANMKAYNTTGSFFETPGLITNLLVAANLAAFGLCYIQGNQLQIPGSILFAHGALYRDAIHAGQCWRLFAAGFLHATPVHLVLNMMCLVSWGGLLEKRVGPFYFIIIYFCSLLAGSVASVYGHPMNFIGIGASGALSGLVGALLCLFILDKIRLSMYFFVGAIGLNTILMASVPRIDWWSHLGGFTAGLTCCAIIDLVAKLNNLWLRCKFPEFVKLNVAISVAVLAIAGADLELDGFHVDGVLGLIALLLTTLVLVKLLDLILSTPRGIAIAVIGFAAFYATAPFLLRRSIVSAATVRCEPPGQSSAIQHDEIAGFLLTQMCQWRTLAPYLLSVLLAALTIIVHRAELIRGLRDVGFVGASLRADRNRCQGI